MAGAVWGEGGCGEGARPGRSPSTRGRLAVPECWMDGKKRDLEGSTQRMGRAGLGKVESSQMWSSICWGPRQMSLAAIISISLRSVPICS